MIMNRNTTLLFWFVRIVAALIMLQTLYFKFTGAKESIEIFTRMGMEPWGRVGTGVVELIASILILIPATVWLGAILSIGVISGAILSHLTILGIEVQGDGGYLFILAVITLICSLIALFLDRKQLPALIKKMLPSLLQ